MPVQIFASTQDSFTDALTIPPTQLLTQVQFSVSSPNSASYQLARRDKSGSAAWDREELAAQPGQGGFSNAYGIRFKSFAAGFPTVVLAAGFFANDPIPLGFIGSTTAFNAQGQNTGGMITGRVNADGTIAAGSGFSIVHVGAGQYTINFTNPFVTVPVVVGSTVMGFGGNNVFAVYTPAITPSPSQVQVFTGSAAGAGADQAFDFIAAAVI